MVVTFWALQLLKESGKTGQVALVILFIARALATEVETTGVEKLKLDRARNGFETSREETLVRRKRTTPRKSQR